MRAYLKAHGPRAQEVGGAVVAGVPLTLSVVAERHGFGRAGVCVATLLTALVLVTWGASKGPPNPPDAPPAPASPGPSSIPTVATAQRAPVILSTTTSTQDSGLLDVLVPMFERRTGYTVKTVAVGTGQALTLAARGEADVVLAHAPDLEKKYVADGKMLNRRLVMYNDFVVIGPSEDPAKLRGMKKATDVMKAIASTGSRFVSRGDNSGTHLLEKKLWRLAGVEPRGDWYIETGQGMGATLGIADDRKAYTLTDRGTYLAFQKRVRLPILLEGDKPLLNVYSVMEVNSANGPRVNAAGGKAFADFMVSPEVQKVIRTYGADKYGQALFVPIAGMKEEDVGGKE